VIVSRRRCCPGALSRVFCACASLGDVWNGWCCQCCLPPGRSQRDYVCAFRLEWVRTDSRLWQILLVQERYCWIRGWVDGQRMLGKKKLGSSGGMGRRGRLGESCLFRLPGLRCASTYPQMTRVLGDGGAVPVWGFLCRTISAPLEGIPGS
jgi:hypothetical protein